MAEAGESWEERQSPQSPGQQPRPKGQHPDPHLPAAVVDEPQVDADFGFNLYQALHHGGTGSGWPGPWHGVPAGTAVGSGDGCSPAGAADASRAGAAGPRVRAILGSHISTGLS